MKEFEEANNLRMLLRKIPQSAFLSIDDCRYLTENDTFELKGTGFKNHFSLYFIRNKRNRRVLLVGDSKNHKERVQSNDEILVVFFSFILNNNQEKLDQPLPDFHGPLQDTKGPMDWYEEQFSFLYHEHLDSQGDFRRGLCRSLVHIILSQMVLSLGELSRPSYSRSDLIRICQIIKNNPQERHSLNELARIAGLSPRHFSRIFTRELGVTPKNYEIKQRMAYGRYLLIQRGLNVQETAIQCGYSDPFHFSKQFKSHYGLSPREYRQGKDIERVLGK
jgi:AraC-like DNA-binding protein